ncbi:hypothetical protein CO667_22650 [Rhizobium sp. L43]|nr:hypothetical protein CO667_22650 [Rhizobium sp. L43]
MPHGGRDEAGKDGDASQVGEGNDHVETLAEALARAGFEPAKVGRKTVSQGRRREPLRRSPSKDPGK